MTLHNPVLMFGWELPPHNSGGLGVACHGLAKGLTSQGVRISFGLPKRLTYHTPFLKILEHDMQGVEVTAINSLLESYIGTDQYSSSWSSLRAEHMMLYGHNLYEEALRFGEMAATWARRQPHTLIHAHDWMTYPAGIRARQISGKPFVAHIHATEYDRTGGNVNQLIADLEYQGLNKADRVIAVSEYTKQIVNRYYGVPKDRITVVHNGIDFVEFEPQNIRKVFPNDKIVLFVGRLTFQKGVEYFLQAAKEVLAYQPDTIFLIVGHGDMYQRLMMEAASLGIANRVVFTGFLSGAKLRTCYQMSDVFVMPSVSEPYGIVALEALACGIPSIISKQSGVSETLSHVLKVDFWDTHKMAELIATVLEYPSLAQEIARQAKREAATLTWEKAAQKTIQVYNQVLH